MKKSYIVIILVLILTSCLSTSRLSDFPYSSNEIPFDQLKYKEYDETSLKWTFKFKDGKDYNVLLSTKKEDETVELIQKAFDSLGYKIIETDTNVNKVIGKRGLRAHEWKSICVAFYNITEAETQIYIMNKVTQDITGGSQYNRAEDLGFAICEISLACKE